MKLVKKDDLRRLAKYSLFENNINELRLPLDHDMDAYKNNSTGALDQPGPQIDGDGNYKNTWESEEELPISADELVNNQSLIRVDLNIDNLNKKNIVPTNVTELSALIQTTFRDLGQNDLSQKEIAVIWKLISKITSKL